jgi:protein phosphatase PTC1
VTRGNHIPRFSDKIDQLWDVCSDQEAVDLVRHTADPQEASKQLVDHALARFSTDNLSCMIVRFDNKALKERKTESVIGVDGDPGLQGGFSEVDAIVSQARKRLSQEIGPNFESKGSNIIIEEEDAEAGPEVEAGALNTQTK